MSLLKSDSLNPWLKQLFSQLIIERTGIQIRQNDQKEFEKVVFSRIKDLGLSIPESYYQLLESESETESSKGEWAILLRDITNSESFFFRDKGQFRLLKEIIFPDLIERRKHEKKLRICSAGCSTGEEPYSIAMLLRDIIPDIDTWDISILGVDVNAAMISKGKTGSYRPWSFRGVEPVIQKRFFEKRKDLYHISQNIKRMVDFQQINLVKDSFYGLDFAIEDMDLILCRNVFIYFSESAIKTVLDKFHDALNGWGYLLVGHAELHAQHPQHFHVRVFEESVVYQRKSRERIHKRPAAMPPEKFPTFQSTKTADGSALDEAFNQTNMELQKTSLNLLRQLPKDTRLPRLGNRTVAELIAQIEQTTERTD